MENIDIEITRWVHDRGQKTYAFWYALSVYGMWLYVAYFLFLWPSNNFAMGDLKYLLIALPGVFVLVWLLRNIIRRPRPTLFKTSYVPWLNRYTFPSIHAATSFAFATSLFLLSYETFSGIFLSLIGLLLYGIALGITISRMMVGVHYASDLLVGALLGIGFSIMVMGI
jgi:undecaprenyl-diphosphatase